MDAESSAAFWLDINERGEQDEIGDPIRLFGLFVSAVTPDALQDIQPQLDLSTSVQELYMKAPSIAQHLARELLKHLESDSEPEVQEPDKHQSDIKATRSSKRRRGDDYTYRCPKSSMALVSSDGAHDAHGASGSSLSIGDNSVTCLPRVVTVNHGSDSLVTEEAEPLPEREKVSEIAEERGQSSSQPSIHSDLHRPATCSSDSMNSAHGQPSVAVEKPTEHSDIATSPPLPSELGHRGTAPEINGDASNYHASPIPSTPVSQTYRVQSPLSDNETPHTALFTPTQVLSPLTEHDSTVSTVDKLEMILPAGISPYNIEQTSSYDTTSIQKFDSDRLPLSPFEEIPTLADIITKVVDIICKMSRRQEVPMEVHSKILATILPSLSETSATDTIVERPDSLWISGSPTSWSASMWINMLEAGEARSKNTSILNMIEWMGASKWFDAELRQAADSPPPTKRGTPTKRLATVVLNKYVKGDSPSPLSGMEKGVLDQRKRMLSSWFHRGRTLRKLVQMTHLGILFHPKIWEYAKANKENIDKIAATFQVDLQKMDLLSTLDEQVKLLAKNGQPDLSRFLDSLDSRFIIPSEEVSNLRSEYGLEKEPVPRSYLDTAIYQVQERIGYIIGKHTLNDDTVIVNGTVELSYSVFNKLRSQQWLSGWDITAALEMTDRPASVRLGFTVPLHMVNTEGEVTPITNPLQRWRIKIDSYKLDNKNNIKQVYVCPLNVNANHFTLLEINEQTEMIYHYDSMAGQRIIQRKTPVRRAVMEEFEYLNFKYKEMPTPQQKDGWSCGLMVIRNAKRRMIGLPVGNWTDEIDPDRVIKEVVRDCQTFLDNDAFSLSKKRKKIAEDLGPSRSSKRLRGH